ncbi:MAG TPA: glycerophosphodiester phosphodiesterase [Acidimicrobiales bacterium]|nr:glycerophosphodiester phosphodiesterase [Acidimicrobiales bacterium]
MAPRIAPLLDPPIGFAHRGARAHAPENTLEAFTLAVRLGATGLESDAWLTTDGEVVLDHDGLVRTGLRRRPISEVHRRDLPSHIPTLAELYEECGTALPLSLDVKDPDAAPGIVAVAREAGQEALGNLWLCSWNWRHAAEWRALDDDIRLVDSTRMKFLRKKGPERRAATLADAGIDAVNLHRDDWTGGLTTLFHRFGRYALGWDAQHRRQLDELIDMGIDGVFSDHVDRMVAALQGLPDPGDPI